MNILVTGGGTVAPIDAVRQITNTSTGGLSARISEACLAQGAEVWHVHTPGAFLPFERAAKMDFHAPIEPELKRLMVLQRTWVRNRKRLHLVPLVPGTVAEYQAAVRHLLTTQPFDVAFLAMAVSDYEPIPVPGKLRSGSERLVIECQPTPKVIRQVRDWAPDLYLVGFKLTSGASVEERVAIAQGALSANRADLIVANDSAEIQRGRHRLHLVREAAEVPTCEPGDDDDGDIAECLVEHALSWARRKAASRPAVPLDDDEPETANGTP